MDLSTLICPKCKSNMYVEKYVKDGMYACGNEPDGNGTGVCYTFIGCVCKTCDKILNEDDIGLRDDVYECKTCGTPQWGYTEYKRDRAKADDYFNSIMSQLKSLRSNFGRF